MTSWLEMLDPEVRGVLEDVLRDSRSKLLRLDVSRETVGPLADIEPLSARAAGWRPAERQLLETYREELWLVVYSAFTRKLRSDEVAVSLFAQAAGGSGRLEAARDEATPRRLLDSRFSGLLEKPTRSILEALAVDPGLRGVGLGDLAVAGRLLIDSGSSLLLGCIVDVLGRRFSQGATAARRVLLESRAPDLGSAAAANLGLCTSNLGDFDGSGRAFLRAASLDPGNVFYWGGVLLAGLANRDAGMLARASERLAELQSERHFEIRRMMHDYTIQKQHGRRLEFDPSDVRALASGLDPIVQEIADVLAT